MREIPLKKNQPFTRITFTKVALEYFVIYFVTKFMQKLYTYVLPVTLPIDYNMKIQAQEGCNQCEQYRIALHFKHSRM